MDQCTHDVRTAMWKQTSSSVYSYPARHLEKYLRTPTIQDAEI